MPVAGYASTAARTQYLTTLGLPLSCKKIDRAPMYILHGNGNFYDNLLNDSSNFYGENLHNSSVSYGEKLKTSSVFYSEKGKNTADGINHRLYLVMRSTSICAS